MHKTSAYFTKSLFIIALECPTKLYYHTKAEYPSTKEDNEFLNALAEGGFQVGALARCYFPDGNHIEPLDTEESIRLTSDLLKKENVTIFEAAIKFENFLIRADILRKSGRHLELIEVKSKSYHPAQDNFLTKSKHIDSKWLPYLYDVAFQTWLVEQAFPQFDVTPYLMLADKSARTTVDGLNQKFQIVKENGRTKVQLRGNVSSDALGYPILTRIPVREYVDMIWTGTDRKLDDEASESQSNFFDRIREYAEYFTREERFPITLGKKCRDCEFRVKSNALEFGQKSGFRECWRTALGWDDEDFDKPLVFDLWDFRQTQECLNRGIYFMEDIPVEDFLMQRNRDNQLEYRSWRAERQDLQIRKMCHERDDIELVDPELFKRVEKWNFPLHFIDFETSAVAIPFNKGRRPYEMNAFQFSCHTVYEDGHIGHDEWIEKEQGKFPNFDFVVELKRVLDKDEGMILRYSHYENTILRQIQTQLIEAIESQSDSLAENTEELIQWIDSVTEWKEHVEIDGKAREVKKAGERNMADMWDLVRRYYYHPSMEGSNSIKAVLPAVLSTSEFLRKKYSKPYSSGNYSNMIWWQLDDTGLPKDPYQLLPPIFEDVDISKDGLLLESQTIQEGGTAMLAYAKMQFTEMSEEERNAIIKGLLKYCELDTLAMVMIWEHWKSLL